MKIALLAKKDKMTVNEIIEFMQLRFDNFHHFLGEKDDSIPEQIYEESYDILISYLSPWIIPEKILKKTRLWNINFHPAPPEYPGIGCYNFALYNGEKSYGVTAHIMEKKVDSGKIIGVKRFPISSNESVYSLSIKSYAYLFSLFTDVIDYISEKKEIPEVNEYWKREPYKRNELEELCKIDLNFSKDEVARRIRATHFPDMPGAYIEFYGYRFEYNPKR